MDITPHIDHKSPATGLPVASTQAKEHPGMRWESFLKTPMNDLIQATVSGSGQKAKVAMQCGLALKVPEFQVQPSIVVDCHPGNFAAVQIICDFGYDAFLQ